MGNCQSFYNASVGRCCRCARSQPRPPPQPVPVVPATPDAADAADAADAPEDPTAPAGPPHADDAEELPQPEMWRMRLPKPPSESSGKFILEIHSSNSLVRFIQFNRSQTGKDHRKGMPFSNGFSSYLYSR